MPSHLAIRLRTRKPRRSSPGILRRFGGAVALALLLMGGAAESGDLADVKSRGKLVLVCFPVLEGNWLTVDPEAMRTLGLKLKDMRDPEHFRGIDIDVMEGFAQSLGVKLEIHPELSGYDGIVQAVGRNEGDMAASQLTITPRRQEIADFSTPYFVQWEVVVVRSDANITSLNDLKGKTVAVIEGSSQLERLASLGLDSKVHLTHFEMEGYAAVAEGTADFALSDSRSAVGEPVNAGISGVKVAIRLSESNYGVAMRKGSDLKAPFDAYLEELRKSGELEEILAKHGQAAATDKAPPVKP